MCCIYTIYKENYTFQNFWADFPQKKKKNFWADFFLSKNTLNF